MGADMGSGLGVREMGNGVSASRPHGASPTGESTMKSNDKRSKQKKGPSLTHRPKKDCIYSAQKEVDSKNIQRGQIQSVILTFFRLVDTKLIITQQFCMYDLQHNH